MFHSSQKKGFVVGYKGIFYTENGGESWSKIEISLPRWIYDIDFSDDKSGWAIGDSGTIFHTEDGGENWKPKAAKIERRPF